MLNELYCKAGGLIILIRTCDYTKQWLNFEVLNDIDPPIEDLVTETLQVDIKWGKSNLTITNIYIPPIRDTIEENRTQDFEAYNILGTCVLTKPDHNQLICGDFNSHHSSWDIQCEEDNLGNNIIDWCNDNNINTANDPNIYTYKHSIKNNNLGEILEHKYSSPDVTLYSNNINYK